MTIIKFDCKTEEEVLLVVQKAEELGVVAKQEDGTILTVADQLKKMERSQ